MHLNKISENKFDQFFIKSIIYILNSNNKVRNLYKKLKNK